VNGREVEVELLRAGPEGLRVRLGEEEWDADVCRTADGAWSVLLGDRSFDLYVEGPSGNAASAEGAVRVVAGGRLHAVRLMDPRRHTPAKAAALEHDGWAEIRAPMPGKVVAVLADVGETVEAGQGVVVVEAMKMENEFTAPKAGKVAEIPVSPGQAVEAGEILAAIE
jgi:biotin carboxyl carrier protein